MPSLKFNLRRGPQRSLNGVYFKSIIVIINHKHLFQLRMIHWIRSDLKLLIYVNKESVSYILTHKQKICNNTCTYQWEGIAHQCCYYSSSVQYFVFIEIYCDECTLFYSWTERTTVLLFCCVTSKIFFQFEMYGRIGIGQ